MKRLLALLSLSAALFVGGCNTTPTGSAGFTLTPTIPPVSSPVTSPETSPSDIPSASPS